MTDAVEHAALQLDHLAQRSLMELDVGEVLEQDVHRLVPSVLELLARQRLAMPP